MLCSPLKNWGHRLDGHLGLWQLAGRADPVAEQVAQSPEDSLQTKGRDTSRWQWRDPSHLVPGDRARGLKIRGVCVWWALILFGWGGWMWMERWGWRKDHGICLFCLLLSYSCTCSFICLKYRVETPIFIFLIKLKLIILICKRMNKNLSFYYFCKWQVNRLNSVGGLPKAGSHPWSTGSKRQMAKGPPPPHQPAGALSGSPHFTVSLPSMMSWTPLLRLNKFLTVARKDRQLSAWPFSSAHSDKLTLFLKRFSNAEASAAAETVPGLSMAVSSPGVRPTWHRPQPHTYWLGGASPASAFSPTHRKRGTVLEMASQCYCEN